MPAYLQGLQKVRKRFSGRAFASVAVTARNKPLSLCLLTAKPAKGKAVSNLNGAAVPSVSRYPTTCAGHRLPVCRGGRYGARFPDDKMSECQKQKPRECDIPNRVRTRAEIRDSRAVARWHFVNGNGLSLYSARGKGTCRACASFPRKRFRGFPDIPLSGFRCR